MDELKIVTGFTKNLISQLVKGLAQKKLGCEVDINLNEFEATVTEEKAKVHLSIDVEIGDDELSQLLAKF